MAGLEDNASQYKDRTWDQVRIVGIQEKETFLWEEFYEFFSCTKKCHCMGILSNSLFLLFTIFTISQI